MDFDPTPEDRRAWRYVYTWLGSDSKHYGAILADALLRTLAGKMKEQFRVLHLCEMCEMSDPRHDWTPAQWLEAAKKKLEET